MRKKRYLYFMFFYFLALSLLPAGCVSISDSPSPRLYMPHSIVNDPAVQKFDFPAGVFIGVGPIKVPEYMNRPQMITRSKDGLLNISQFQRWAELIDAAILRMCAENLNVMLPGASILKLPWSTSVPMKYQISIDIIQIDSDLEKNLRLIVYWNIFDADAQKTLFSKRSELSQPIIPHDYFGLNEALSAVIATFSSEIAEQLSIIAKQPKKKH